MKVCLSHAHAKFARGAETQTYWMEKPIQEWVLSKKINEMVVKLLENSGDKIYLIDPETPAHLAAKSKYAKHLRDTVRQINTINPDIAIECHFNAHSNDEANGVETLYHNTSSDSHRLAVIAQDELTDHIPMKDRGVKPRANLLFLKYTNCPAIIIEPGFLSNWQDRYWIWGDGSLEIIAKCIAKTIIRYKTEGI